MVKSNAEWYDEIYREHSEFLERIARRLLNDKEYAEDIVQDTFEYVLYHFEEVRSVQNVRQYLTAILKNKIMTRNQLLFQEREIELDEQYTASQEDIYGYPFRDELPEGLSDEEKDILCLFFDYQYSHREIGRFFGCSPLASGMRLMRAKLHYKELKSAPAEELLKKRQRKEKIPKNNDEPCYNMNSLTKETDRRCNDV